MGYISKEQLEKAAKVYHRRYASLPEFQDETISSIDPQLMAEKVLGLKLAHHKLSRDLSILGFSTKADNVGLRIYDYSDEDIFMMINPHTIVVHSDLKEQNIGRYHFTVMHEVAHHIINRFLHNGRNTEPHYFRFADSKGDYEERQADALASLLLMPKVLVDRGMTKFDINRRELILPLLPQVRERFAGLAEYLGVSKEALKIRLTDLGYLHNIIVDPPAEEEAYC